MAPLIGQAPDVPRSCFLILFVLGFSWVGSALAQAPETPVVAEPFELSEVTQEFETLARLKAEARVLVVTDPAIDSLREDVRAAGRDLVPARTELHNALADQPGRARTADIEQLWKARVQATAAWREVLGRRLGSLESTRAQLIDQRGRWEATLASTREEAAPAEVGAAVQAALEGLSESDQLVSNSVGRLFALQQELSGLEVGIEEALREIRAYREAQRASLLEAEAAPLWALDLAGGEQPLMEKAGLSAGSDFRAFLEWWRASHAPRGRVVGLVLGALLLTLALRARAQHWSPDDPRRERGRLLLRRPWSMALTAGLGVAALMNPAAPRPVVELMGLVLLLPALRVLSVAVPSRFHTALIGLAGFYVLDRVRGILEPLELLERWLLLFEMMAALGILFWLLRPKRLEKDEAWQLTSPFLLWAVTRLGVALLSLSIVGNALGYVDLSRVIGEGVFHSVYLGVVIVGVLQVARNFLAILVGSQGARAVRMIRIQPRRVERAVRRGMAWAAALGWVHLSLGLFAIREAVYGALVTGLTTPIVLGEVELRFGDPVLLIAVLWLAVQLSRLLRFVLQEEIFPRIRMQRGVPNALSTMLHYAVMLLALWIGFSAIGLEWDRLAIVIGALGVGIGFGLQNVVNNFVSGLILLFERPVQVGDTVQMGPVHGDVRRIGARSSTIRTWDGSEIIVPNADLVSQQVINWTLSDRRRRIDLEFGVAYGTDPEAVQAILQEAASQHPEVLETPAPSALFTGFGDSALLFELRAWVRDPDYWMPARSDINVTVNAALAEAGIEIPFPQRDIHFRTPLEVPTQGESEATD
ncbi:MAG: mechanosensitive ion channel [bacterium]|nr:mechanosensitive ion channel [bacterium]